MPTPRDARAWPALPSATAGPPFAKQAPEAGACDPSTALFARPRRNAATPRDVPALRVARPSAFTVSPDGEALRECRPRLLEELREARG
jgi:hypothetical protein